MMTLAELIAMKKGDESYEAMARRGGMSGGLFHKFATGKNTDFPEPATITGLARAVGVPERVIVMAAAAGLGFDMRDDDGPQLGRMLPIPVDDLPDYCKRVILDQANAMVAQMLDTIPSQLGAGRRAVHSAREAARKVADSMDAARADVIAKAQRKAQRRTRSTDTSDKDARDRI